MAWRSRFDSRLAKRSRAPGQGSGSTPPKYCIAIDLSTLSGVFCVKRTPSTNGSARPGNRALGRRASGLCSGGVSGCCHGSGARCRRSGASSWGETSTACIAGFRFASRTGVTLDGRAVGGAPDSSAGSAGSATRSMKLTSIRRSFASGNSTRWSSSLACCRFRGHRPKQTPGGFSNCAESPSPTSSSRAVWIPAVWARISTCCFGSIATFGACRPGAVAGESDPEPPGYFKMGVRRDSNESF